MNENDVLIDKHIIKKAEYAVDKLINMLHKNKIDVANKFVEKNGYFNFKKQNLIFEKYFISDFIELKGNDFLFIFSIADNNFKKYLKKIIINLKLIKPEYYVY